MEYWNNIFFVWNKGGIMAITYKTIATTTVGSGGTSSINFTSIPQTYTDLLIRISLRDSRADFGPGYLHLKFNDITTNYSGTFFNSNTDSSTASTQYRTDDYISFAINTLYSSANTFGNGEIYICNYTASQNKSLRIDSVSEDNNANNAVRNFTSFLWSNNSAVTKITLYGDTNLLQHSTATLYGIKNTV